MIRWAEVVAGARVSWRSLQAPPTADDLARRTRLDALYAEVARAFPDVPEVHPHEAIRGWAAGELMLLDVRDAHERAVSSPPGALDREDDLPRDRPIVCLCTIGMRSGHHALLLRARGVDARNLAGGILAWTHAGGDLVTGGIAGGLPTRRVHTWSARFDLIAQGYEASW